MKNRRTFIKTVAAGSIGSAFIGCENASTEKSKKKSFPNTSNNYLKQLALVGRRTGSAKITKKKRKEP